MRCARRRPKLQSTPGPRFGSVVRRTAPAVARLERAFSEHLRSAPSFSARGVAADEDVEAEWAGTWDDPTFTHFVATKDERVVGHVLLYRRPAGDLRIPDDNIDLALATTHPDVRGSGVGRALTAHALHWAHEAGFPHDDDRLARRESPRRPVLHPLGLPPHVRAPVSARAVSRVPLLAGSQLVIVTAEDDALVLRPPHAGACRGRRRRRSARRPALSARRRAARGSRLARRARDYRGRATRATASGRRT